MTALPVVRRLSISRFSNRWGLGTIGLSRYRAGRPIILNDAGQANQLPRAGIVSAKRGLPLQPSRVFGAGWAAARLPEGDALYSPGQCRRAHGATPWTHATNRQRQGRTDDEAALPSTARGTETGQIIISTFGAMVTPFDARDGSSRKGSVDVGREQGSVLTERPMFATDMRRCHEQRVIAG